MTRRKLISTVFVAPALVAQTTTPIFESVILVLNEQNISSVLPAGSKVPKFYPLYYIFVKPNVAGLLTFRIEFKTQRTITEVSMLRDISKCPNVEGWYKIELTNSNPADVITEIYLTPMTAGTRVKIL